MSYPPAPPARVDLASLTEPVYRGSVQNLYSLPDHPGYLLSQTTDAGSVFDVGSIFHINGSDLSRSIFRHAVYSRLSQAPTWQTVVRALESDTSLPEQWRQELRRGPLESMLETGAATHHVGMVDGQTGEVVGQSMPATPSTFNVIRRFPVMTPPQRSLMGGHVFDYVQFHQNDTYVIPLEYIVRFGVTSGSSILKKYESLSEGARRSYELELGLSGPMHPWSMLVPPIFDLTSKYEPEDRSVSRQEALLMSGLGGERFQDTIKMALLGSMAVREVLNDIGLVLWDLKWEFAVDRDSLLFVDTIDSDSFRATRTVSVGPNQNLVVHFNKQAMRDYYRILHPSWFAGVNDAKAQAKKSGQPFKKILVAGQQAGHYPPTPAVEPEFLKLQGRKTELIRLHVLSPTPETAASIRHELEACGQAEAAFYRSHDRFDALLKVNGV